MDLFFAFSSLHHTLPWHTYYQTCSAEIYEIKFLLYLVWYGLSWADCFSLRQAFNIDWCQRLACWQYFKPVYRWPCNTDNCDSSYWSPVFYTTCKISVSQRSRDTWAAPICFFQGQYKKNWCVTLLIQNTNQPRLKISVSIKPWQFNSVLFIKH